MKPLLPLLALVAFPASAVTVTVNGCDSPKSAVDSGANVTIVCASIAPPDPPTACTPGNTTHLTQAWGGPSKIYPNWPANNTLVVAVAIPANAIWGDFVVSFGEYNAPPTYRRATLSRSACDFRERDNTGVNGPFDTANGNAGDLGGKLSNMPPLKAGETYYFNFRNEFWDGSKWVASCGSASCQMVLGWSWPR